MFEDSKYHVMGYELSAAAIEHRMSDGVKASSIEFEAREVDHQATKQSS